MLQKVISEPKNTNSSKDSSQSTLNFSKNLSKQILFKKYSKFEYSYTLLCTNNLVFNEKCRLVARFKDYLVLDDSTEFLRRFYLKKELPSRLKKIYNFYESYCKIFPNYMILPESQFLYRNIRKKQKMIDAFNEIKKEEEENRKHLKIGLSNNKKKDANVVFTKKIQESIERYHPSLSNILSNTFMSEINNNLNNENENNNTDRSIVTISLNSQRQINFNENNNNNIKGPKAFDNYFTRNSESFTDKTFNGNANFSQNSILKIVQILNTNNQIKDSSPFLNNEIHSSNNNENIIKQNKKDFKANNTQANDSNKNIPKKINNNKVKHIAKKSLNLNNNYQMNNNTNTINAISKHYRVKTNLNNSNNKKKKPQEINVNTKKKFISHKQNISVPLAANMLNSHDNNINNIIERENNTIKIINNINNIIINDDKNKTINNGMIININNNYFQLKSSQQLKNNLIKRLKSKEEQIKDTTKENKKIKNKNKENVLNKYKIFSEKRNYTTYNTQNNNKKNKKFLINEIQSPNNKKEKYQNQNTETKKKSLNTKKYLLTMNNNNLLKNPNFRKDDKENKKLIENKPLITTPNEEKPKKAKSKNIFNSNHIAITESNTTISTSYNRNKIGSNKLISKNKNNKKLKEIGIDSVDKKKISINRKLVNNYFTATHKKKTFQGRFHINENIENNTFSNKQFIENSNINVNNNEKLDFINICNTIENKSNPIKFKLNKKNLMKKKAKTNSLQINNKNEFLSSFNLPKDKMPGNHAALDILNIEDKMVKYRKNSLKKLLNYKTQTNSEAELIKDINKNRNILNTIESKSIKREKIKTKAKINNNMSNTNNKNNLPDNKEIKKLNVKEMKEKYHKLLRGNKFNHGSYDIANRLHLFKKFKGLNTIMDNMTNSINTTINENKYKRSPLTKKILSPSERLQNSLNNYIKTPIKKRFETNKEINTIEVINLENKFKLIEKKNKQIDTNNKKMKFLKK